MLVDFFIIGLLIVLLGVFPVWPHSQHWGYTPAICIAALAAILMALLFLHVI